MAKRLLVTISISFSIRYIIRTGLLKKLKEFCDPVLAFTWNEVKLIEELKMQGFEVHIIPEAKCAPAYNDARKKIDYWFNKYQLKSPSTKIQQQYLKHIQPAQTSLLSKSRRLYNEGKSFIPGNTKRLFAIEEELLLSHTNFDIIKDWLDSLHIDAAFSVTPFHKQEDILLRACKLSGKKMFTAILSFDNLTKRGWIPVLYDAYMLWNNKNQEELLRIYPDSANKTIAITGAPQFDFYFNKEYVFPKSEWKKLSGLPDDDRKIILYAGGPESLFPQEPQYLKSILDAIHAKNIPGDPIILFRCHPIDHIRRWQTAIGQNPNLFYDESWTGKNDLFSTDIKENDIRKLCSTLAYTNVHINICSTMAVDGSAFHKTQVWPAFVENDKVGTKYLQRMYQQEHFQSLVFIMKNALAFSKEEMIKKVEDALTKPYADKEQADLILKSVITFTDGKSMERVARVLQNEILKN